MLKRTLLGFVLVATCAAIATAAYEVWTAQGEITIDEAITIIWNSGDGSWDPATLTWTVVGYPGDTLTAEFDVENTSNSDLQVVATVTIDQPLAGVVASWVVSSECIASGRTEPFELDVVVDADAVPGTMLISYTFQREGC